MTFTQRTAAELAAGLDAVRRSPRAAGRVVLIVARPLPGQRAILDAAHLDVAGGLVGDGWQVRAGDKPDRQLTVMNARAIALLAGQDPHAWALAGDQLYVDLDLSVEHLPPGSRLVVGDATIEISATPHTGCAKFASRFGVEATRWVSSPEGRALNLRGIHARVVAPGTVRTGDAVVVRAP